MRELAPSPRQSTPQDSTRAYRGALQHFPVRFTLLLALLSIAARAGLNDFIAQEVVATAARAHPQLALDFLLDTTRKGEELPDDVHDLHAVFEEQVDALWVAVTVIRERDDVAVLVAGRPPHLLAGEANRGRNSGVTQFVAINPGEHVTDTWVDGSNGRNGARTRYEYNGAGEVIKEWRPGVDRPTLYQRDVQGRVTKQTTPDGVVTEIVYDLAGRATSSTRVGTDGTRQTTSATLDAAGRITSVTEPNGHYQSWTYDRASRVTSMSENLTSTTSRTQTQSFDAAGNLVRATDPLGNATWNTYNSWGLLEQKVEPSTAGAPTLLDRSWTYRYEPGGEIASETAPGGVVRESNYDIVGQLREVYADDPSQPSAYVEHSLTYSKAGALTSVDTPSGVQRFTWGSRGQLLTARGPLTNADYSYDDNMRLREEHSYKTNGVDTLATTTYWYDAAGRPAGSSGELNGKYQSVERAYDINGRPHTDTYRSNDVLDFAGQPAQTGVNFYDYDAFGRRAVETLRSPGGAFKSSTSYTYDSVDNIVTRAVDQRGADQGGTYQYDLASRILQYQTPGVDPVQYSWDAANNRTSENRPGTKRSWTYDERNRPTSFTSGTVFYSQTQSITSDARGNVTAIGNRSLAYNALDQLSTDGNVSYQYDGLGRLSSRNSDVFLYRGTDPEPRGIRGSVGTGAAKFTTGISGISPLTWNLSSGKAGGAVSNTHGDSNGLLDTTGTYGDTVGYGPFGTRSVGSTGTNQFFGFEGNWTDPASGSVYMGARWYDPALGGFLSRDSLDLPLAGGSMNRYSYGNGNPVNSLDPTGHISIPIPKPGIGGLIGGIISGLLGGSSTGVPLSGLSSWLGNVFGTATQPLVSAQQWVMAQILRGVANVWQWMQQSTAPRGSVGSSSVAALPATGPAVGVVAPRVTTPPPPPRPIPVDATRPGWTWTQSASAATGITRNVNTPTQAQGATAEKCGLGGTLASCQTPTQGIFQFCASPGALASVCTAAEPAPGRPGASRSNVAMTSPLAGATTGAFGPTGDPGNCSPAEQVLGVCSADPAPRAPSTRAPQPANASDLPSEIVRPKPSGGIGPVRKGQEGENAVRSVYDIGEKTSVKIKGTDRTRIFDGLNKSAVTEIKNVNRQSFTLQIKDSMKYALENDLDFHLYIRGDGGTRLSGPLEEMMSSIARFEIRYIP